MECGFSTAEGAMLIYKIYRGYIYIYICTYIYIYIYIYMCVYGNVGPS